MYAHKTIDLTRRGLEAETGLQYVALAFRGGTGSLAGALIGGFIAGIAGRVARARRYRSSRGTFREPDRRSSRSTADPAQP